MTTLLTDDGESLLCPSGNVVCPKCSTVTLHAIHTSTASACLQNLLHATACKDETCSCGDARDILHHAKNCWGMGKCCGDNKCKYTKLILKHKSICSDKECKLCENWRYYADVTKHYSVSVPLNANARFDGGVATVCESEGGSYIRKEVERENRVLQERLFLEKEEVKRMKHTYENLVHMYDELDAEKKALENKAREFSGQVKRRLVSYGNEHKNAKDKVKRLQAECFKLREELQKSSTDQVKRLQAECSRLKDELARSETAKIEYFNRVRYLETCKNVEMDVINLT